MILFTCFFNVLKGLKAFSLQESLADLWRAQPAKDHLAGGNPWRGGDTFATQGTDLAVAIKNFPRATARSLACPG